MMCLEPSDSRPRDGLPCGRYSDQMVVYPSVGWIAMCWQHIKRLPNYRRKGAVFLKLARDGVVSDQNGEIGKITFDEVER